MRTHKDDGTDNCQFCKSKKYPHAFFLFYAVEYRIQGHGRARLKCKMSLIAYVFENLVPSWSAVWKAFWTL